MLSYSLVLAIFLLGPGFATYAGIFFSFRGGRFQAAPPPPNSIFSLAVVGLSALVWHTGWAIILAVDEGLCRKACLAVPFDPDVYSAALGSAQKSVAALSGAEVAAFLSTCLGLSVAAFFVSVALARVGFVTERLRQPLYGLYAGLAEEAAGAALAPLGKYVTAYVLTDLEKDGAFLCYFGVLENLQVGVDKQVAGVAIVGVDTFLLRLGRTVQRTSALRDEPIDRIIIAGAHLQNIAFEIVQPS